jgi:tRNA (guanine26-N2/guanine27-N2)-dimethyltransferase
MIKTIQEANTKIKAHQGKISKQLPVFYNPVMEFNRTTSILLLKALNRENLQLAFPLAGSGIRPIRIIKELPKKTIKTAFINDYSKQAINNIRENLKLNKIPKSKIELSNTEANLFLLNSKGFDYIDIDPFGSPNPFLDSAVRRLARKSILAVTATDTSALCGTYPKACARKYFAHHIKNPIMHELGLRILARKVQLIAAQYDRALTPIFSYSRDHYVRIFFHCEKSKEATDKILKQHSFFNNYGPLWTGQLLDKKLTKEISKLAPEDKFLKILAEESKIPSLGYFHIHKLCKAYKLRVPKKELLIQELNKQGFKAVETHFSPLGIRTKIPLEKLIKILKKLNKKN